MQTATLELHGAFGSSELRQEDKLPTLLRDRGHEKLKHPNMSKWLHGIRCSAKKKAQKRIEQATNFAQMKRNADNENM